MSSSGRYSFDSESALSEDPDGAVPVWRRSRPRDCSECEEAAASRAGPSTATRGSSRRSRRLASASDGRGTETASLLDGRSSSPSECEDTGVQWVQALCLALLALTSALFIGAVALGLMHSLPATWPTPQAPLADAAGAVDSGVNPSLDTTRRSPVVQDAGRLADAAPMRDVASSTVSTETFTETSRAGRATTEEPGSSQAVEGTTPQAKIDGGVEEEEVEMV
ncbi:hypothetical protein V5799_026308 [Amblyomma americanum]|uniref:Uncharacterized protein n=1 Tax=Amblyomma americanum TaxID=6943 RepID=A0AAQ4DIY5_AMBAM